MKIPSRTKDECFVRLYFYQEWLEKLQFFKCAVIGRIDSRNDRIEFCAVSVFRGAVTQRRSNIPYIVAPRAAYGNFVRCVFTFTQLVFIVRSENRNQRIFEKLMIELGFYEVCDTCQVSALNI